MREIRTGRVALQALFGAEAGSAVGCEPFISPSVMASCEVSRTIVKYRGFKRY